VELEYRVGFCLLGEVLMRRLILATSVVAVSVTMVHADSFMAVITKVEANKVTFKKATFHRQEKKYTYADPVTVEISNEAAITWGHFVPADGPTTSVAHINAPTEPVKGGLDSDLFKSVNTGKARPCVITIADQGADKGKITRINLWKSKPGK
jgi:hypothetical protein